MKSRIRAGFDGCNWVTVHIDQEDPNHLLVLGNWESRQHHEQFLAWRAERGDLEKFMAWFAEEPTANYFDDFEA
jgi:quinol monooxygenase YgiN